MINVKNSGIRFEWNTTLGAYVVFCGTKEVGKALDIDGVISIIHFLTDENEYTSNSCDNESDER